MTLDLINATPMILMGLGIIGFSFYMRAQLKGSWIHFSKNPIKSKKESK